MPSADDKPQAAPLTPPEVADVLRAVDLRAGYIIGTCQGEREMRLEAEEIKRLLARAFKGLRDWWHGPHAASEKARGTHWLALPTEKEIAAYRDLFRRELDKNMHNSSGSPSTDAHHVALHAFVEARNRGTQSPTAPRRRREGADRECSPACDEKARTYCSWKGF